MFADCWAGEFYTVHPLTAQYVHRAHQAKYRFAIQIKLKIPNLRISGLLNFTIFISLIITSPTLLGSAHVWKLPKITRDTTPVVQPHR